jgi:hypothetical protein
MSSEPPTYKVTAADPAAHLDPIAKIISDAFAGGDYLEEIQNKYLGGSHYDYDVSRLIWDGNKLVHHWGVWGYPMRVESVLLKAGGIGAVVTLEDYRKQGLMAQAAVSSFEAMRDAGYDVSILRGRHYTKFGYRRAWNYVTTKLNPANTPPEPLPEVSLEVEYRPLGPADMVAINELYNREYAEVSGSCVRPTYPMLEDGEMGAYGWHNPAGELLGYVRAIPTEDKKALQCLEAAGNPSQGLAVLGDLFAKGEYEQLHFFTMPQQHPVLQIVRQGACTVEDRSFYHTGWQIKVINLHSTLNKLVPLFEHRLVKSAYAGWKGCLHLEGEEESATLELAAGQVSATKAAAGEHTLHAGPAFGRLLIGSDDPVEIFRQEEMTCTGLAGELARVLFPNLHPMMSHWDEF